MSEEMRKSVFDLFAQAKITFEEAIEKEKRESGAAKVERFRIGEDGDYSIRVLQLAPDLDENGDMLPIKRKGYEYPVHQFFLKITLPAKRGKKAKVINVPVVRATDEGVDKSIDLIDTYLNIAKEMYGDDEELIKLITGNSFGGGLRWSYQHAIMVLDLTSDKTRAIGPQLWQCSHSQYKVLNEAAMRLWKELRADGNQPDCPVSGFTNAYPVKVIRKTDTRTQYTIEIGRKTVDVTEDEARQLLELPRIPELIYRFTRYQLEAEVVFLQQYDEQHQMEVCKEPDFIEAVEKLKAELPETDTSHFDLASAGSTGSRTSAEVTIDSLWSEYDQIADAGLSERSDEYQELREKIRQFAEDKNLDVRLSRQKNNKQLLEEIEDAMDNAKKTPDASEFNVESKTEAEDDSDNAEESEKEEPEEPVRRRRPRPTAEPEATEEPEEKAEEVAEEAEERPLHRRRRSR